MPDFDHFPDSNFSATMDEPMEDMIVDSQKNGSQKNTQDIALDLSQSQMRGLDSLLREESTQISEMIDFTQDEQIYRGTSFDYRDYVGRSRRPDPSFATRSPWPPSPQNRDISTHPGNARAGICRQD
ncbi:hypothetical protein LB505_006622 [Fusarium chuoi]|nr:hypothetical protein LB505_006622 [Fusarium chuoi]